MDQSVTMVRIRLVTGCANSAQLALYGGAPDRRQVLAKDEFVGVPTGFLACPHDCSPAPRRMGPTCRSLRAPGPVGWTADTFAAFERGETFVEEVRAFFRTYRT
jgi:hypothetical protein